MVKSETSVFEISNFGRKSLFLDNEEILWASKKERIMGDYVVKNSFMYIVPPSSYDPLNEEYRKIGIFSF